MIITSTAYTVTYIERKLQHKEAIRSMFRLWCKTGVFPLYDISIKQRATQYKIKELSG